MTNTLNATQTEALIWARNLEAQGMHLMNGVGARVTTVRTLVKAGLMTIDEGWERPWTVGFRKEKKARRVWMATLTDEGKRVAATL